MIDPIYVREHAEAVRTGLHNRGLDPDKALENLATLETARRRIIPELEGLKRQQNTSGDEIARAKRMGQDTGAVQEANRGRAQQIKQLGIQLDSIEYQRTQALMVLPNLPHSSVPAGKSAADNQEVRRHGEPRVFDFEPQPHWDLGPKMGIIDFERATRIAGARFSVLSGAGAQLRALSSCSIFIRATRYRSRAAVSRQRRRADRHRELPKFEPDLQDCRRLDLYLCRRPVPLTNLHLASSRRRSYRFGTQPTPCFEAGRIIRPGCPRPDSPASIRQGGLVEADAARAVVELERHVWRRRSAAPAGAAVRTVRLHRRHGFASAKTCDISETEAEDARNFLVQQHRSVQARRAVSNRAGVRRKIDSHADGVWPGGWPHPDRVLERQQDGSVTIPRRSAVWTGKVIGP